MANVKSIPQGLHSVTAQIAMDGAADAIAWFHKAFGAEEGNRAMDPSGKKIWHSEVKIAGTTIFVNDVFPEMGGGAQTGNFWIYGDDVDGRFKRAVDAGATVKMPPMDMFWGDRMCCVTDKWGNTWNLAQHVKDMTPDEMKKAQDAFIASMPKK